jgi:hypothetical protein
MIFEEYKTQHGQPKSIFLGSGFTTIRKELFEPGNENFAEM